MIGTLILAAAGACIVRHAWRWARHSEPTRIVVQGYAPADLILTDRQAEAVARLACWAWARPVAVCGLMPEQGAAWADIYHVDGRVEHRAIRPRHA